MIGYGGRQLPGECDMAKYHRGRTAIGVGTVETERKPRQGASRVDWRSNRHAAAHPARTSRRPARDAGPAHNAGSICSSRRLPVVRQKTRDSTSSIRSFRNAVASPSLLRLRYRDSRKPMKFQAPVDDRLFFNFWSFPNFFADFFFFVHRSLRRCLGWLNGPNWKRQQARWRAGSLMQSVLCSRVNGLSGLKKKNYLHTVQSRNCFQLRLIWITEFLPHGGRKFTIMDLLEKILI